MFAPPQARPPIPVPNAQAQIDAPLGSLTLDPATATLVYDVAGNRQLERPPGGPAIDYVVNQRNEYTSVGGVSLAYDAVGVLRSRGPLLFVYNARNQLVRVHDAATGADIARFFHDTRGRRIAEDRGGVRTHLLWNGANPIEERRDGSLFTHYVTADEPDAICQLAHSGSEYWLHRDAIGSTRLLSDQTGTIVGRHRYSPFGVAEQQTGPYNPVRFAGRRFDADLGLYDMRARTYSPELGRFLQPDPKGLAGGWNLYGYAAANPLTYTDPMGTDPVASRTQQVDLAPTEILGSRTLDGLVATAAAAARDAWRNHDDEAARFYEQEVPYIPAQRRLRQVFGWRW